MSNQKRILRMLVFPLTSCHMLYVPPEALYNSEHTTRLPWQLQQFSQRNKLFFLMCGPGTKMAAALPSFSDRTSAWRGDKHHLWRGTEEEAAQITSTTIPGFGGAGRSRGHCLAVVSYFVLLLKVFLGCGWHFIEQRRGKHFKWFCKFSSLCLWCKVSNPPVAPPQREKGKREGTTA